MFKLGRLVTGEDLEVELRRGLLRQLGGLDGGTGGQ